MEEQRQPVQPDDSDLPPGTSAPISDWLRSPEHHLLTSTSHFAIGTAATEASDLELRQMGVLDGRESRQPPKRGRRAVFVMTVVLAVSRMDEQPVISKSWLTQA
jgi:hypothetical protein